MMSDIVLRRENKKSRGPMAMASFISSSALAIFLVGLILVIGPLGCGQKEEKQKAQVTAQGKRRSLAIMYLQNQSQDPALDWLSQGIAELLITDLSQSTHLNVLRGAQLFATLRDMGKETLSAIDTTTAMEVAKKTGSETMLIGSFSKAGETVRIDVRLVDVASNAPMRAEMVEGLGVESIFTLVDQLSRAIKNDLSIPSDEAETDLDVAEMTTGSVDAFKVYSQALNTFYRFQFGKAMVQIGRALELDPSFPMAYVLMASRSQGMGDSPRATSAVSRGVSSMDKLPQRERLMLKAIDAHVSSDYDQGIRLYQKVLQLDPEDPDAALGLAKLYFDLQQYQEADSLYQKILQKDPKHVTARLMLGLALLQQGRADLAETEVQQALQLSPDNQYAYFFLSRAYAFQGRPRDALLQLRKASSLAQEDPWIHNLIGYFYLTLNQYDAAIEEFKLYVALAPNDPNAYDSMGEGYLRKGELAKAEKEYLYALELKPDFASPHYMLGMIYQQKGQTQAAIEKFEQYLQLNPAGPLAQNAQKRLENLQEQ